MISSCSVIIRKSLSQETAVLGIRAAWAMFSNGNIDVQLVLLGDGIYSALGKNGYISKMFARFISEAGNVYAVEEDLNDRAIGLDLLPKGIKTIPAAKVAAVVGNSDSIMTF